MKVIAINGSPRTNKNTSILLQKALDGAKSKGAEVELINLYKLNYKGCISCFSCKRKRGKSLYKCAIKDDLMEVFEKIKNVDAVIFGSPIYFFDITGEMRSFLERLLFQYLPYDKEIDTYFPRELKTAFIYTMGAPEGKLTNHILNRLEDMENFITKVFWIPVKTLYSNNAYQFDDYSKYEASVFSVEHKIKHKEEQFPIDCQNAFELGKNLLK